MNIENFSERLKQAIKDRNITASELSRLSGVGKADISNYINKKYLPKQDKIFMLAKALRVNPGWLMTGVEQSSDRERARIVVPDSELFVKLVHYMPQDEYLMIMDAFERASQRMKEAEENSDDRP